MKTIKKIATLACLFSVILGSNNTVKASEIATIGENINQTNLELTAETAVLLEASTGKVLYNKDMEKKMYPASMTKMMTALITLEHLNKTDVVVAGDELDTVPWDSSVAGNIKGESILVENIIRGLIIPSGNDSATIAAMATAKVVSGNPNISYSEAEKLFTDLMNKKAEEIGCKNTHFANPHGYHNENHYSTAYDMALITKAAMENELIKDIASEKEYHGNSLGLDVNLNTSDVNVLVKEHNWVSHNLLINDDSYGYKYATGFKTGFTDEASDCVAATALKNNKELIAVVMYDPDPGRWIDAKLLFEFGFNNYKDYVIQEKGAELDSIIIANNVLGEKEVLPLYGKDKFEGYYSKDDMLSLKKEISYKSELLAIDKKTMESGVTKINAPIKKDDVVASINYYINDNIVFTGDLLALNDVNERTFGSTFKYNLDNVNSKIFSLIAIPFWIGGVTLLVLIISLSRKGSKRKRNKNYNNRYRRY